MKEAAALRGVGRGEGGVVDAEQHAVDAEQRVRQLRNVQLAMQDGEIGDTYHALIRKARQLSIHRNHRTKDASHKDAIS